jgi:hypothetical protein
MSSGACRSTCLCASFIHNGSFSLTLSRNAGSLLSRQKVNFPREGDEGVDPRMKMPPSHGAMCLNRVMALSFTSCFWKRKDGEGAKVEECGVIGVQE